MAFLQLLGDLWKPGERDTMKPFMPTRLRKPREQGGYNGPEVMRDLWLAERRRPPTDCLDWVETHLVMNSDGTGTLGFVGRVEGVRDPYTGQPSPGQKLWRWNSGHARGEAVTKVEAIGILLGAEDSITFERRGRWLMGL